MRVVAVLMAAAALATGCSGGSGSGPRLKADGSDLTGGADRVPLDTPYVLPLRPMCTTGKPIHITKIAPARATGMRVLDWAVRLDYPGDPYPSMSPSGSQVRLSRISGFSSRTPITARCDQQRRVDEVDVSLSRTVDHATMTGVWVYYGSGHRVFSQYSWALCAPTTKLEDCRDPDDPHRPGS
jgi:hypothetical protein